jgi:hypothetical protein
MFIKIILTAHAILHRIVVQVIATVTILCALIQNVVLVIPGKATRNSANATQMLNAVMALSSHTIRIVRANLNCLAAQNSAIITVIILCAVK